MFNYIVRRLIWTVFVLFGVSILIFTLTRLLPGDTASIMLGERATPEVVAQFREEHGLNDPIPIQYIRWVSDLARGDLGKSLASGRLTMETLQLGLRITIPLAVLSIIISVVLGVTTGIIAGVYRDTKRDHVVSLLSFLGISFPSFYLGLLLILLFSVRLRWFPVLGFAALDVLHDPIGALRYLFLPALTVGLIHAAAINRMVRSNLLEVLRQEYVMVARAKGLYQILVILKHALRNAMIPTVTVIGIQFGEMLGGLVITEQVFTVPGLGRFLVQAVAQRDYPVIQGAILFFAGAFALVNLLTDLLYTFLDPRVKLNA